MATRRNVILGAGIGAMSLEGAMAGASDLFATRQVQDDLARYDGFGLKASGGAGDEASGAWLTRELQGLGFEVRRQAIEVPYFEERQVSLALGDKVVAALVQAPVTLTPAGGLSASCSTPS